MYMHVLAAVGLFGTRVVSVAQASNSSNDGYNLRPFTISLSSNVSRMLSLINNTQLPGGPEHLIAAGIPLESLKSLQTEWLTQFDWEKEELAMNA